jgi:hypothetical protein
MGKRNSKSQRRQQFRNGGSNKQNLKYVPTGHSRETHYMLPFVFFLCIRVFWGASGAVSNGGSKGSTANFN